MQTTLKEKLWAQIVQNNPDLLLRLQEERSVSCYLDEAVKGILPLAESLFAEGKPRYVIEELCLEAMTGDLKPSRYQYILSVLEEEFEEDYDRLKANGILTYETVNLTESCKDIFDDFDFRQENQENRHLRYAITGQVHHYLTRDQRKSEE
ncbi:MAG: DUF1896 family protein [Prolixibacteraceae bacterium]|jgi:hypothetical protein|nr:DUF1896 family protein [Prolixibacteraceae bacterium]